MTTEHTTLMEHDLSVKNWWHVCLKNGHFGLVEKEWNPTQMKKTLYELYQKASVGNTKGIFMFWKHLQQHVNFVSQDYESVVFPTLEECRHISMDWKLDHDSAFVPKHSLIH